MHVTDAAAQTSDPDTTPQLDKFVKAWTAWSEKHGLELPTHTGIEWSGCCPAHEDREPSLTTNVGTRGKHGNAPKALVVSCFSGCTAQDVVTALGLPTSLLAAERETPVSSPATKRDADSWPDPSALPTADELQHWHSRLLKRSERLAYLTSERGLTKDVIRDHWIGWSGRAYTLPVFDRDGNLLNVRRYLIGRREMWNTKDCGSPARLYPEPPSPGHRHVVVTEGEWDALVARSHGIEAYSGTGGANKWPPGAAEHFAGITVYVIYDCDESGRSGALKVARDLHPHAHAVRIVDLGLDDREDLTDWFVKYGRSKADLWSLLHKADRYEPQGEEKGADESGNVRNTRPERQRLVDGLTFILNEGDEVPAIWGDGHAVLWAEGEGLMLAGPQGAGKTTIAQQLILHRLGIRDETFLNYSVRPVEGRVLYLAMDRPRQAARSLRRMVDAGQYADVLADRLAAWQGPIPLDATEDATRFADFCEEQVPDLTCVVIDSLKDLAPGLSEDKVGAAINQALQELLARGIELVVLHHQRKANADNRKPKALSDVYGSVWLTAGLGSVVLVWGEAGATTVELIHLKQPEETVGPLQVVHDHARGRASVRNTSHELLAAFQAAGERGLDLPEATAVMFGSDDAYDDRNLRERTRRALKSLEDDYLESRSGKSGGSGGGGKSARWWLLGAREAAE